MKIIMDKTLDREKKSGYNEKAKKLVQRLHGAKA